MENVGGIVGFDACPLTVRTWWRIIRKFTRSGGYRRIVASVVFGLNDNTIAPISAMDACFAATVTVGDLT
jgi:hypothetical protein